MNKLIIDGNKYGISNFESGWKPVNFILFPRSHHHIFDDI